MSEPQTVVIGIDGAHFELIKPWLRDGQLPNIKRIVEQGVTGDLESVLPPVTSPNWKAYATGQNPGRFGIFWWENIDVENQRVYYPSERKNEPLEFWELLADSESVGVLGVPTTYPPKDTGEFLVSGAPDGEEQGFATPADVETFLTEQMDYKVNKDVRMKKNPNEGGEEILKLIDLRFRAARRLMEDNDLSFLHVTTFYINTLQHFFWDGEYTLEGWKIIDDHAGDFLNESENVVLMSDHGSNPIETVFHINTWLEDNGYLQQDTRVANTLDRVGVRMGALIDLAELLRVKNLAAKWSPE